MNQKRSEELEKFEAKLQELSDEELISLLGIIGRQAESMRSEIELINAEITDRAQRKKS